MNRTVAQTGLLAVVMALGVASCSSDDSGGDTSPDASSSASPSGDIVEFGSTLWYDDGLEVSLSAPKSYTPTEDAAVDGDIKNGRGFKTEVTVTNGTLDPLDPTLAAESAVAAGEACGEITDDALGERPSAKVLPGKKITYEVGFMCKADEGADLQADYTPDSTRESSIFTGTLP